MKHLIKLVGIVLCAACLSGCAVMTWPVSTKPFKIAPRVYYVGTAGLGSYLFETDDGLILLDGTLDMTATQVKHNVEDLGFRMDDVNILLNSHAHSDHSGGLAKLKRASGAKLEAMYEDVDALQGGYFEGSENNIFLKSPKVTVDRVLHDPEKVTADEARPRSNEVTLGDVTLTAILTPGHSPGCTSWAFDVVEGDVTYKALILCSANVGLNRIRDSKPQYKNIAADYRATFEKTKAMHVDIPLSPHAEDFRLLDKRKLSERGDAKAFVNPREFRCFMLAREKDFEDTYARRNRTPRKDVEIDPDCLSEFGKQ